MRAKACGSELVKGRKRVSTMPCVYHAPGGIDDG